VRDALDEQAGARRLFLCGISMGALLSLRLAAEAGSRIHALALIAPAVSFVGSSRLFTEVVGLLPRLPYLVSKGGRDIQARAGQARSGPVSPRDSDGAYDFVPLRWGRELRLLSREALADAPRVRVPTLLLQGGRDQTVSPRGTRKLAGLLGSDDIALRVYPRSGHVLPLDLDGPAASKAVVRFFLRSEE
jgi:pimeloyl-ACP methyl ester carboxylesterase